MTANAPKPPTRAQRHTYHETTALLIRRYGSHEKLSQELYKDTGVTVAANSIGRWFRERTVPIHIAIALSKMADDPSIIGALFHELHPYLIEEAKE